MRTASISPIPDSGERPLRIAFMGTPAFAVPSLRALIDLDRIGPRPAGVVAVVTQPDRPAGRGGRVQASPVKATALAAGIPVLQPERLRRPESVADLRAYAPDLIVVAAFAQILSREVLAMPTHGCLNVHASLLPRWRGAAPIAAAILAGDDLTGVTIMQMDPGLDTGPILAQRTTPISATDSAETLTERLATLGAALLVDTLAPWIDGSLVARPQDERHATLTRPLRRADGVIDWSAVDAVQVTRMIRAYHPWPGAHSAYGGRTLKVLAAEALDATVEVAAGHVLSRDEAASVLATVGAGAPWPQLLVRCREGVLWARLVQPEGKRAMDGADFMRGQRGLAGARLG